MRETAITSTAAIAVAAALVIAVVLYLVKRKAAATPSERYVHDERREEIPISSYENVQRNSQGIPESAKPENKKAYDNIYGNVAVTYNESQYESVNVGTSRDQHVYAAC